MCWSCVSSVTAGPRASLRWGSGRVRRRVIVGSQSPPVAARFRRIESVMRMALLNGRGAHQNKARPRPQLLDVPRSTIAHARAQPADELIDEGGERTFVRHPAFDAFGNQLAGAAVFLAV